VRVQRRNAVQRGTTDLTAVPAWQYTWEDQTRGGGVGGRITQSGGFSGAARQWRSVIRKELSRKGTRINPSACIPHLSKQAAASGHGAFVGVSQHPQGLDFPGAIILSQSLMASAASSSWAVAISCSDRACWSAT